jgi:hypothetical protein
MHMVNQYLLAKRLHLQPHAVFAVPVMCRRGVGSSGRSEKSAIYYSVARRIMHWRFWGDGVSWFWSGMRHEAGNTFGGLRCDLQDVLHVALQHVNAVNHPPRLDVQLAQLAKS